MVFVVGTISRDELAEELASLGPVEVDWYPAALAALGLDFLPATIARPDARVLTAVWWD
jgi:hypothetical protein